MPVYGQQDADEKKAAQIQEEHEKDFEDGEKGESGEYIRNRQRWFHDLRAYPLKHIPAGIRQRAVKEKNKKVQAEQAARAAFVARTGSASPQTAPAQPQWSLIGPQPIGNYYGVSAGRVTSLAVNPSNPMIVYAGGAEGGVWKTTNGGANWVSLTDNQPSLAVGSIAIDPTNVNTIYVGTGEENFSGDSYYGAGVLKSTDGGTTWTQYCGPFCGPESVNGYSDAGAYIGGIAVDPKNNQIILAAVELYGAQGVYRSINGGSTWTLVTTDGGVATAVVFDPVNAGIAYAASETAGILKSTNHGQSWTVVNGSGATALPTLNGGRIALALAPSSPSTLYTGITDNDTSGLLGFYKTTDGGATWNQLTNITNYCGGQCWYDNTIGVSPVNANVVFAGGSYAYSAGSSAALRSLDGGNSWTDQGPVHPDAHAMAFSADGTILYTGNDGGVWSTANPSASTVSWTSLNSTLALAEFYPGLSIDPANVNHSYGGTQDNGTNKYTGSLDWPTVDCGDGGSTAIDPSNPGTVYTTCVGLSVDKSTNDGGSFTSMINGISTSDHLPFIPTLTMDPQVPQNLYFGTYRVYQTTNGAAQWTAISPDLTYGDGYDNVIVMTVAPKDSNTIYTGTNDGVLFVTRNALSGTGATWTKVSGTTSLPNRSITAIAVDPATAATAYAGFNGFSGFGDSLGHIFMTTNAGATWTDISSDLPNTPVNAILVDPDSPQTLFIGTDIGAFYTSNSGASWSALGTGLPNTVVTGLALHENSRTLRASTHGRSVWDLNVASLIPVPSITSISPASVPEGNPQFTLTVNGFQFASNSVVQYNGTSLATTYVSATQLTAIIPASDVAVPGSATITVYNPTTSKLSNSATLTIYYVASSTTTTLTATPTSGAEGTKFTFKAMVTDRSGPETGGSVSFYNGTELLATVHLITRMSSDGPIGSANYVTRGLPIGTDAITAKFTGTALDSVSTSAAQNITVTGQYATATKLTSSGSQGSYVLNAAVAAKGLGTPTGTVTFTDTTTGTTLGSAGVTGVTTSYVSKSSVSTLSGANDVALGDVNNDGIPDLVVTSYNGSTNWVTVALGNGDGTFGAPTAIATTSNNGGPAVTLADVNGDGNLDIVACSYAGAGVSVFLGTGTGTFGAEQNYGVDDNYAVSVATGDFNGDGKVDIVTADYFGNTMSVLLGNGDGTFQTENAMATDTSPQAVAVGDFNGDGNLDIVVANSTGTVSVYINNGGGTFQAQSLLTADSNGGGLGPKGIATGDFNGDGKTDIVVGYWSGGSIEIFFGNGNGTFQAAQAFSGPASNPSGVAVADLNADGRPDIVTSSSYNSIATVFLSNGNGTFAINGYPTGNSGRSVALADLNGDGIVDIVSLDTNDQVANVLLGQTGVTSSISGITLPGVGTDNVTATYSGDGKFTGSTSNTLALASNKSAAAAPTFNPAAGTYSGTQNVMLADATNGASIYYTTNGSTPTTSSTKYSAAIAVSTSETIKAVAIANGYALSSVSSAAYTIQTSGVNASVSPASIAFGSTKVGSTSSYIMATLTNNGAATITGVALTITGANASSFFLPSSRQGCTSTLAAGASCTFYAAFSPTTGGALAASVQITDSASNSPQMVALSGTATGGTASVGPTSLAFANTNVGSASADMTATLTNSGSVGIAGIAFSITGTNASSFSLPSNHQTCTTTLAAGASCTFDVVFTPTTGGALTGSVQITDSATNSPQTVALSGAGVAAGGTASVSPASIAFASTKVGSTSSYIMATLTNNGTTTLTGVALSITGTNASSFSLPAGRQGCAATLAGGASCTFYAAFSPTTSGALTATVQIKDSASNSPQTVALSGTGLATGASASVSPASLAFPNTNVGSASADMTATLTNSGSVALSGIAFSIAGTNASSFSIPSGHQTCTATLAVGASCNFDVVFAPATGGALTATVQIADSASNSPQTVALSGTGVAVGSGSASVSPANIAFANTNVGSTSSYILATLTNGGSTALSGVALSIVGPNASSFFLPPGRQGCTATLAAGASCTFYAAFKPTAGGALTASVQIADSATNSPQRVALSGTGVASGATASVSPTSLAFSNTNVGSSSADMTATLTNTGSVSLTGIAFSITGANASSFSISPGHQACTATLAVGASCQFDVVFQPATAGSLTATVQIADSAGSSPQTVALSGTGGAAGTASVSPTSIAFATTTVGSTSSYIQATLTNNGSSTLSGIAFSITGINASSFLIPANHQLCTATLAAGASCTFDVAFKPTAVGGLSGSVQITDGASNSPQTVALSGTGR